MTCVVFGEEDNEMDCNGLVTLGDCGLGSLGDDALDAGDVTIGGYDSMNSKELSYSLCIALVRCFCEKCADIVLWDRLQLVRDTERQWQQRSSSRMTR
jgi:hypothetical protein